MFEALKQLILSLGIYPSDSIFQNYPNDAVMPEDNNFVVMNELHSIPYCALVQKAVTPNIIDKTVAMSAVQLVATHFQIDFYGDVSRDFTRTFATTLQSGFANSYFIENNYPFTVKTADAPLQLTHNMDREEYILKFAVKLSLFNNATANINVMAADQINITPTLIETIKP